MITLIPLEHYYSIYVHVCLFLVLANLIHAYTLDIDDPKNLLFLKTVGFILLFMSIAYLGLRPISGRYFGDMGTYSRYFNGYVLGESVNVDKDFAFHYYMKLVSNFTTVYGFFFITEFLYIFPMYLISKIHFEEYWFYAFFMFLVSFSFYTYGVNGIRNGVATSMFLWGLCYHNKKALMILFFVLAALFHKTLLLPIMAYVVTLFYNKPMIYIKAWLFSIPLSFVIGGALISVFTVLGFGDDRLAAYLSESTKVENVGKTGFRWDFIFYSSFAVFTGWYFIIKNKFEDKFYNQIYGVYLICNSFWILVIRANFSNRFAYLSWFLMAIIIIYPFLKKQFFEFQEVVIAKVVIAYFSFTYLMWLVYYG